MAKLKVTPLCKYGHGNLERNDTGGEYIHRIDPYQENSPLTFLLAIYECPKCTYLELHDVVDPTEGR